MGQKRDITAIRRSDRKLVVPGIEGQSGLGPASQIVQPDIVEGSLRIAAIDCRAEILIATSRFSLGSRAPGFAPGFISMWSVGPVYYLWLEYRKGVALLGTFADKPVNTFRLPSFRAEHFPYSGPYPWLDLPDAEERIADKLQQGKLTEEEARQCRFWVENGYVVIGNLFEDSILQSVWSAYEDAVRAGKIVLQPEKASADDPLPGRFLNPHRKVGAFCQILKHPQMLHWLGVLTERQPKPLQTIAGHKGSQQGTHSDSIHMTTYPLGYLTAAWIAFEDIHPDCGPLVYYPGSHRLPYVFSKDVGITESEFKNEGYSSYHAKYEPFIQGLIEKHRIEPHYFHAKKGDVLIWHANLLHGGSARKNMQLSRKAVVCHFFVKGSFVYHDLAASRSTQQYVGTCMLRDEKGDPYWRKTAKRPTE